MKARRLALASAFGDQQDAAEWGYNRRDADFAIAAGLSAHDFSAPARLVQHGE